MIAEPGTRVSTDELDKRLDECQRLQQKALDLTGLKIGLADANKVAILLPKWWVEAMLDHPGLLNSRYGCLAVCGLGN
jgi:hypothetical protein